MLFKKYLIRNVVQQIRFCSVSVKSIKKTLILNKTTYPADDWTNITKRLEPFVGATLFKRKNHPLRLTQEEIVTFFQKWYQQNVSSDIQLPIYKDLDPVEPNTSKTKDPKTFYVNRDLMLRTHSTNREIKFLKKGIDNFVMVVDLYRRCEMDTNHFPAFHRVNIIRSLNCEQNNADNLRDEQRAVLVEMLEHLMGHNVKFRWTDVSLYATDPSWMLEVWHLNEWQRIAGGGLIRNEIFEKSNRTNSIGWEIAIALDRLAMILYHIFDIRLLWNANQSFLKQFEPQQFDRSPNKQNKVTATQTTESASKAERPKFQGKQTTALKTTRSLNISFILPNNMDLESFPMDDLCKFIKNNTESAATKVIDKRISIELIERCF